MARVQRGNVVLRVADDEVSRYLQLGYDLTSDDGSIIQPAIPHDFSTLQRLYLEHTTKIAELEDMVAKLTAELSEVKRARKQAEPAKTTTKKTTKS